jgi:LmbE family N-acetylglucosaminyl deacetylase
MLVPCCYGQEIQELPEFKKEDRVLIFAPHPDDEAIGAAGVIQRSLKAQAQVRIVCFTSGDHNEFAFIAYERRLTFRRGEFIHMGKLRMQETLTAMKSLGIKEEDIYFLGYPDYGTKEILLKYWETQRPFRDRLTRISSVPYDRCLSPAAPYVGESILADLKKILRDFKPNKIFVSHPADINRDHQALYVFLRVALWDLEKEMRAPAVYPYLIHAVKWPLPRGFHPELPLETPLQLTGTGITWYRMDLTEEEIAQKQKAISLYKTQLVGTPHYLVTFARKNELFGDYSAIRLKKEDKQPSFWHLIETLYNEEKSSPQVERSDLIFQETGKQLLITIVPPREMNKSMDIAIALLGYSKEKAFADMPKIYLQVKRKRLFVKEKRQPLIVHDIHMTFQEKEVHLKVPLVLLDDPDYLFVSVRSNRRDVPLDGATWRVLQLR